MLTEKTIRQTLHELQVQLEKTSEQLSRIEKYFQRPMVPLKDGGHTFSTPRPAKQGMNHTASEYRVCTKCGNSDVYLHWQYTLTYPFPSNPKGVTPCPVQ